MFFVHTAKVMIKVHASSDSTLKTYQRTVLVQTGVYSKGSTGFLFDYSNDSKFSDRLIWGKQCRLRSDCS